MKPQVPKFLQTQESRIKAKSQLNCSGLLTGLNQIQGKMKEYQQRKMKSSHCQLNDLQGQMKQYQSLHKMRNSHSQLELKPNLKKQIVITPQKDRNNQNIARTDKSYTPSLATINEHNQGKPKPPKTVTTFGSNSMVFSNQKPIQQPKTLRNKPVNAYSKEKDNTKEKNNNLRLKTKQLQQQFLSLFGGEMHKKNQINKDFSSLFKLFD